MRVVPSLLALALLAAGPARADVPDDLLARVRGFDTVLSVAGGGPLRARVLAFDATSVTIVTADGTVRTLWRRDLLFVKPPAADEAPGAHDKTTAILSVAAPATVAIDVDVHGFYAFAAASLVAPAFTGGKAAGGAFGLGASFAVGGHWHLDVFAHVAAIVEPELDESIVGYGIGVGAHVVYPSGFTFAFKLPLAGWRGPDSTTWVHESGYGGFLAASFIGLPVLAFGYRF